MLGKRRGIDTAFRGLLRTTVPKLGMNLSQRLESFPGFACTPDFHAPRMEKWDVLRVMA